MMRLSYGAIAIAAGALPGRWAFMAPLSQHPRQQRGMSFAARAAAIPPADGQLCSILFDFDGTLGDTETPAMQVAYWEICPYLPGLAPEELELEVKQYVRENAGKAFEFMIEACDDLRKEAGLASTVEGAWKGQEESPAVLKIVDIHRASFGLPPLRKAAGSYVSLLEQQKIETVDALGKVAAPTPGMIETLEQLKKLNFPMAIATTSPKPRVPVSVVTAGLSDFFPDDKIHSGESDFDPPRFKPAPDVYLRAAAHQGALPGNCIAVEDSASGVGSASNAGLGLIVGYVGASHFAPEMRDAQAHVLMSGDRSENGRGAEVVITDMEDLTAIAKYYRETRDANIPESVLAGLKGKAWKTTAVSA